ncbi:hypothetical protein [Streptomyces sp. NBC_01237]|uniref:hypothetical protein n=1 Tax=Streptomyces sp. NBC_01237 TaxID=2903790 RepID=UPI002DDA5AD3|nr:hypothetical protein [Streptomyces sp. NBC_01237]WRZ77229.1 hypothetical protein OG251_36845 [Streptomyces sp. NBC_01237]
MKPQYEPVIDQHDTWLAVNPVQGCPKDCSYCYLKDLGLTLAKPAELATPADTLTQLLASRYYHPRLILALYTCTDALATPRTRAHLIALLDVLGDSPVRNPVCLITKCAVTDDVVACIRRNQAKGLRVIVYLSYSGLGPDIERGIDHGALKDNFPRLHAADIPVIHYWRPALPQNSTSAVIESVMDLASRYARCSVAVGTKVKPTAKDQITALWPQLADPALDPQAADSVWPRTTWDWLRDRPRRYDTHPVYQTNCCALAYVLGEPDHGGIWNSPTCLNANHCPPEQRNRCAAPVPSQQPVTPAQISERLRVIGLTDLPHSYDRRTRTLVLSDPVPLRDQHNLAQVLRISVRAPQAPGERYWSGRLAGGTPLIVDAS